jgi:hypothetical protein
VLSLVVGGVELRVPWQRFLYIECVFENDLVGLDAAGTLAAAEANEHALITAETAAWRLLRIGPICIPAMLSRQAGCRARNGRSGWAMTVPRLSGTSRRPNSGVCCASRTARPPGSSPTRWISGTGIARVENVGPILPGRLQTLLGNRCAISLKPVIDLPAGHISLDSYEIPASLREQLILRDPADVFPRRDNLARRGEPNARMAN